MRLFLNGNLQFHSRDEYRYHEALVHPALAAHGAPQRVLVLGGGDGMAVREVLKHASVERVTLVELDPHMTQLFSTAPLLRDLNGDALRSPKVTIVNADAFGWLEQHDEMFDAIVVDFPDPTNFSIGKLYTRAFYELLERHLSASGYAVVQTTSPLIARKSFWTVATTIEAAGLATTPYHAHVPSFGEWGFIVASRRPFRLAADAAAGTALPHRRRPAGAVRLPARHGARAGRGEPAVEPGAGADLRGRVGQGAAVSRSRGARRGADAPRRPRRVARRLAPLAACTRDDAPRYEGGWVGADAERGHLLRSGWPATKSGRPPEVAATRRVGAIVVGAGIAGLGAARALLRAGVDECHVLELEDSAGGNSRGHAMAGMRCPLGAHYLPLPGANASEVIELLEELGVRRSVAGRAVYDERMLCHSPQERLFIDGGWHDGLLPPVEALPAAERATTLAAYRAFGAAVAAAGDDGAFAIPTARSRWSDALAALDRMTFAAWLDAHGLAAPALRWYLDYCCRDDYGAGSAEVSAWAGLHYFASRHGFHAPGDETRGGEGDEGVLTWPEGNAWLAERLAAPLGERLPAGRVVARRRGRSPRGQRRRLERATGAARALDRAARRPRDAALRRGAIARRGAGGAERGVPPRSPCAVAGRQPAARHRARRPPRRGAVVGQRRLRQQRPRLRRRDAPEHAAVRGATVLTAYCRARRRQRRGARRAAPSPARRRLARLGARVIADLAPAHPDLAAKVRRVDLMRYGHAMSIPAPGVRSSAALQALAAPQRRVHFAHADLSAYSVFEEALFHGMRAGRAAADA